MQRYYEVLDTQPSASIDQIKAQYRQLVRIYHPDRFSNGEDRLYAEEKLKEINEAYSAIVRVKKLPPSPAPQVWTIEDEPAGEPKLALQPTHIDFGEVVRGATLSHCFTVSGNAAHLHNLKFTFSQPNPFFSVEKRRPLNREEALPAKMQLQLQTNALEPGLIHSGWVQAELDGAVSNVSFSVYIKPVSLSRLSPRWATAALLIVALLSIAVAGPLVPQLHGFWPLATTAASYQPSPNQLVFAATQNGGSRLFAASPNGTDQQPLDLAGRVPVWSPTGEQMIYLSVDNTLEQLHLFGLESSEHTLLTQSTLQKSAPVWSADGTQVAYIAQDAEQSLVQVLNIDRQTPRNIYEAKRGEIAGVAWLSADALLVAAQVGGQQAIYRVQAGGGTPVLFTQEPSNGFDVNPLNGQVALATNEGLLLLNESGTLLARPSTLEADVRSPKWSTDGLSLAFLASDGSATNLWLSNADDSGPMRLTTLGCLDFFWSPDDRYIAYITGSRESASPVLFLWVLEINNGQSTLVAEISEPYVTWTR